VFYWVTVFAIFALGTAVGDLFATTFGLGYLGSALIFCGVILIPWIGWKSLRFDAIFAFWFAYVTTRPLGASLADYFSKSKDLSGLGFGDVQTAAVLTALGRPGRLHGQDPLRHPAQLPSRLRPRVGRT
jgi:uncharacterized membrane-anchored protein